MLRFLFLRFFVLAWSFFGDWWGSNFCIRTVARRRLYLAPIKTNNVRAFHSTSSRYSIYISAKIFSPVRCSIHFFWLFPFQIKDILPCLFNLLSRHLRFVRNVSLHTICKLRNPKIYFRPARLLHAIYSLLVELVKVMSTSSVNHNTVVAVLSSVAVIVFVDYLEWNDIYFLHLKVRMFLDLVPVQS